MARKGKMIVADNEVTGSSSMNRPKILKAAIDKAIEKENIDTPDKASAKGTKGKGKQREPQMNGTNTIESLTWESLTTTQCQLWWENTPKDHSLKDALMAAQAD